MGIREIAMSPDSGKEPERDAGYKPYPSQYGGRYDDDYNPRDPSNPRYDGNYNGSNWKDPNDWNKKEDKEDKSLITISMIINRKEMGPKYDMDNEAYDYDYEKEDNKAKEMSYDRLLKMLGPDFTAVYEIQKIEVDNGYEDITVTTVLKPIN
jgi:hypothetical protein